MTWRSNALEEAAGGLTNDVLVKIGTCTNGTELAETVGVTRGGPDGPSNLPYSRMPDLGLVWSFGLPQTSPDCNARAQGCIRREGDPPPFLCIPACVTDCFV